MITTAFKLSEMYLKANTTERFGQWFINRYIKDDMHDERLSKIFYEENDLKSLGMIARWCLENCYTDTLPPRYRDI